MEGDIEVKGMARSSEFSAGKPLPPIGTSRDDIQPEPVPDQSSNTYPDDDQNSNASTAFDRSSEGKSRPRIVRGFRPESPTDEEMENQRSVSFSNGALETTKRKTYDGREVMFVTLDTQTDWDWVEKVETTGSARSISAADDRSGSITGKEKSTVSPRSASSKPDAADEKATPDVTQYQMPYNDEYGIPILDLSSDTDDSSDEEFSHKKIKDDRTFLPSVGPPNILQQARQKRRPSISESKRKNSVVQYQRESEKHDIPVEDPEARAPDLDGPEFDKDESGVTHGMFSGSCEFCSKPIKPFPTVEQQLQFPPEQLYCCNDYREFVEFALNTSNEMEEEQKKKNKLISIKPHEHVGSKQERNAAKEKAVQRMRERELARRQQEASGLQQNFFASGPGSNAAPGTLSKAGFMKIPGGLAAVTMKDMFGISQTVPKAPSGNLSQSGGSPRRFLESGGAYVDISPSDVLLECLDTCPCYSDTKRGVKVAKELGILEQNEEGGGRDLKYLNKEAKNSLIGPGHSVECVAYQTCQISKLYLAALKESIEVARQMKTINYQLSSQKCLEEGWTLRAPSPLMDDLGDDVFVPEPLHPDMIADGTKIGKKTTQLWLSKRMNLRDRPLIEKFYENGQKFLTMFPDGTGNVFYPSGNLAILISSVKLGQYYYTIHQDQKRSDVAAAFEPNGYGYCYFPNGDIRLYIDQYGGLELDNYGARRRKWSWKDQVTHVHAPPFQPICIGINKHTGLRLMTQDNIALTFSASKRSCRFNMGSRLKLVAPENAPLKEIEEEYIFLEEKKNHVDALLNKVANLLKFPNNPKLDQMLPPLHITSRQTKTEKMKRDRQMFLAQQSAREKKQPSITVNS